MKRSILSSIGFKAIIAGFVLMLIGSVGAKAYCTFINAEYYYQSDYAMSINIVKFESSVIQKWDTPRDKSGNIIMGVVPNYYYYKDIDATNKDINVEKDKVYKLECYGGANSLMADSQNKIDEYATINGYYSLDFKAYIDFNQDNNFDEETELAGQWNSTGTGFGGVFNITVPKDAKSGKTTMRIVSEYYASDGNWGNGFDACNAAYGEGRDYVVNVKAGFDIGISAITSPTTPLSAGIQPVKAMLRNYATSPITSCTINWSVDAAPQTAYKWTGNLAAGASIEVTLGTYNFKSKGVSTTYTLLAATDKPNGQDDGNLTNDASPTTLVSMPIGPGIYYVGGASYDFATLKQLTDLVNSTGISGDGDFIVRIRPGTYTGPFTMDNFKHGNLNFIFENDPANPGTVTITSASTASNYVWYLNNIPNVIIRNLKFTVTDPSNLGGRIFMIRGNANNYTFENNTFTGLTNFQQTVFKYSHIDCQASPMNNHKYLTNIFNNGYLSLALINSPSNSSGLEIKENTFNSFSNRAIRVEGIANGVINANIMAASTVPSAGGIFVQNGTVITNNTITGLVGVNTSAAGITVLDDVTSSPAEITGNSISNSTGIIGISATGIAGGNIVNNTITLLNSNLTSATSGITLTNPTLGNKKVIMSENLITMQNGYGFNVTNYPTDILKNRIQVTLASSKVELKGISAVGSTGMILMNEIISGGEVFDLDNSTFTVAYNSTLATGSLNAMTIDNGSNKIFRNQIVNKGTGNAFAINTKTAAMLDGNNYTSTTGTLGTIAGVSYTNPTQMLPYDKNARSLDPKYKSNTNLMISEFFEDLAFYTPLTNVTWPQGYQAVYEENTKDGKFRDGTYYVGAFNIFQVVDILAYTPELIECAGSEDMSLYIAGTTTCGSQPNYQWFKDGTPIPGATAYILKLPIFDYTVSGTYSCRASIPGAKTKYTAGIPVYAVTIPSIVKQPMEVVNAVVGNNYKFDVGVHYRGIMPPFYKDMFQWYKYDALTGDSIALPNNSHFAGAKSSELILTNLQATDICKQGDFYFVKIQGQCGTVFSNPFVISETPEVVFRDNPADVRTCLGEDVVFTANAIAPTGFALTYKWTKDGADLANDAKFNGVTTNKLQIFNVQTTDLGNYVCIAEILSIPTSKNSNIGLLSLKEVPDGKVNGLADITTKRGNDVIMKVDLLKGEQPITVKWYYKEVLLKEGLWDQFGGQLLLTLALENVNENQSGQYKCVLVNECAETELVFNLVVTKWDEAGSVEVISENGYALYACMPNPSNGSTKIRFEMPETNNAVITLVDQTGRKVSTLFNAVANKGMNVLEVNTESLNVSSGIYFYMISANGFNATLPMVIVK